MRCERWKQIEEIFNGALDLKPSLRDTYVRDACGGDSSLQMEIKLLLSRQVDAERFLEPSSPGASLPQRETRDLTGETVLHYHITERIGAGGMGVVYRAEDLRLGRVVALKFLHDALSCDSNALARLQREARAASALDHPHICKVFDIAEYENQTFLVLEHLVGETLAERMERAPLPFDEALQIGVQIADALDAAHEQGIIHRDLKPSNIMLTKTGAKLLDFGLAKLNQRNGQAAPSTKTANSDAISLTIDGALLGTCPYMAPEHLEGKPTARRADIWAFGVILYEALAGKRPFEGPSQASLIAAILEHDPVPLATARPGTPALLEHLVTCCLAKKPDARWESAHDLADQLRFVQSGGTVRDGVVTKRKRTKLMWMGIAGSLVAGLVVLVALIAIRPPRPVPTRSLRLAIALPEDAPLAPGGLMPQAHDRPVLALSPDGTRLAYVAQVGRQTQICIRDMGSGLVTRLPGTEGGHTPFFSPDGAWLGFFAEGKLKRTATGSGPVSVLTDAPSPYGAAWGTDGVIYFNRHAAEGIYQIDADGGPVQRVATGAYRMPELLGSTRGLLATSGIGTVFLDRNTTSRFLIGGFGARYVPTGHLVYSIQGRLLAIPFDPSRIQGTGPAVSLVEDLRTAPFGVAQFALARDGTLVYATGQPQTLTTFVWVDRNGGRRSLGLPARFYSTFHLSPDGKRLVFAVDDGRENAASDIWIYDLVLGTTSRLTRRLSVGTATLNLYPRWTPDGRYIVYFRRSEGRFQLIRQAVGGSAEEVELWASQPGGPQYLCPMSFSPDRALMTVFGPSKSTGYDIFLLRMQGADRRMGRGLDLFLGAPYNEYFGQISRDGHWMLYVSDQSGRDEIYVTSYPDHETVRQISTGGGHKPLWNPTRPEIIYRSGTRVYAVAMDMVRGANPGQPRLLFEGPYPNVPGFDFDIALDGRHFLMLENNDFLTQSTTLNVITNFYGELQRLVRPAPARGN